MFLLDGQYLITCYPSIFSYRNNGSIRLNDVMIWKRSPDGTGVMESYDGELRWYKAVMIIEQETGEFLRNDDLIPSDVMGVVNRDYLNK